MNVDVETICPSCKGCNKLTVEEETIWVNDEVYEKVRHCKYLEICKKAIEVWEKQNESNHHN